MTKLLHAAPHGRVTRRSKTIRHKAKQKPLPMHLQVLPQRMSPIPRNPACYETGKRGWGAYLSYRDAGALKLLLGRGLSNSGPCRIALESCFGGRPVFCHNDSIEALAYVRACQSLGIAARLYIIEESNDEARQ